MSNPFYAEVNAALALLKSVDNSELKAAMEKALFRASDEVKKAETIMRGVAYLASCQAATAERAVMTKSTPKSERVRQANLCGIAIGVLDGDYQSPDYTLRATPEEQIAAARERLQTAMISLTNKPE